MSQPQPTLPTNRRQDVEEQAIRDAELPPPVLPEGLSARHVTVLAVGQADLSPREHGARADETEVGVGIQVIGWVYRLSHSQRSLASLAGALALVGAVAPAHAQPPPQPFPIDAEASRKKLEARGCKTDPDMLPHIDELN